MPFISVNTAAVLTKEQKDEIKTRLGRMIELLPGKAERGLMIDISCGHTLYYAGVEQPAGAFVDVRLYKESPFEAKVAFNAELVDMLSQVAGINKESVYCNYLELPNWGGRGGVFR